MGGWLTAWESHSSRGFLDGNDPDKDEAARKDVDEGDKLGEEAVRHVARSLKVPLEDGHKDKMNCKNRRHLWRQLRFRTNIGVQLTAGKNFLWKR